LLKPGALTPEEYDVMKKHAEIGFRILAGSGNALLELGAMIAFTHHEKYDGSGYPRGLVGDEIPIEGRVAAIADVFDALTSKRVYRDALPITKAIEVVRAGRGSHFDPDLLEIFLALMPEVLRIREQWADRAGAQRS
jgi:putative two-component system response regulator